MAVNFPGPYEVRLNYAVTLSTIVIAHQARYNVRLNADPAGGTLFSAISALNVSDAVLALNTVLDNWVVVFRALFASSMNIIDAELWKYDDLSFESNFISSYPIGVTGNNGSGNINAAQNQITFRTQEGGIMRVNFMEGSFSSAQPRLGSNMNTVETAAAAWVTQSQSGQAGFWLARDTSYPFSAIGAFPGVNEALWRKRYRIGQ